MPLGSSSAAPVTSPGPKTLRTFRIRNRVCRTAGFSGLSRDYCAALHSRDFGGRVELGTARLFFRTKSEKLLGRI